MEFEEVEKRCAVQQPHAGILGHEAVRDRCNECHEIGFREKQENQNQSQRVWCVTSLKIFSI